MTLRGKSSLQNLIYVLDDIVQYDHQKKLKDISIVALTCDGWTDCMGQ